MKVITKSTRKTRNRIFEIPAAATAIPVKPRTAAIIATSKNISAQYSIQSLLEQTVASRTRRIS